MKREKYTAIFSLILGISILISWVTIIFSGQIFESTLEISFHIFSELIMALFCITGGVMVIMKHKSRQKIIIIAYAMVVYSLLNAIGYYLALGDIIIPLIFSALLLVSTTILFQNLYPSNRITSINI